MRPTQARARVWSSIRMLRRFTVADIEATAEAGRKQTEDYVRALVKNEYVRLVQPQRKGGPVGSAAVYLLVRDTGPAAPRIGKSALLDPNLVAAKPEPGDELLKIRRRDYERALLCVRACAGMTDEEIRFKAGLPSTPGGAAGESLS